MPFPNNVYFLLGVPCAGKTTMADILCKKHGMYYFGGDAMRFCYFKKADKVKHPAMTRNMSDYFDLSADKLVQWERDVIKEQTPMALSDLKELSYQHEKILFDGILNLPFIPSTIDYRRIVYLTVSREIRERDFFSREDHLKMIENIKNNPNISDAEKERRIVLRRTVAIDFCPDDVHEYGLSQFIRNDHTTVTEELEFVERHFDLIKQQSE